MSPKHLDRYVRQFAGKRNIRLLDKIDMTVEVVRRLVGKRLTHETLFAPSGLAPLGDRLS